MRPVTYRLLAIDLDGTLLTHDRRVTRATRRALDEAATRGCGIVIATGRGFNVLRRYCDGIPLTAPQITYNGAVIHDPTAGRDLARYLVPAEWVLPAIDFLGASGVYAAIFTPTALYMDPRIPNPRHWMPAPLPPPQLLDDLRAVADQPCIKVVGRGNHNVIARIRPYAVERFGHALYVTQTAADLLEFLHPEVCKGAALRRIAHLLDIPREQIIAIGDSHNDLEMLEFAGTGVAMGNAAPELHAIADMVTTTNDEDGIAVALERLGVTSSR